MDRWFIEKKERANTKKTNSIAKWRSFRFIIAHESYWSCDSDLTNGFVMLTSAHSCVMLPWSVGKAVWNQFYVCRTTLISIYTHNRIE